MRYEKRQTKEPREAKVRAHTKPKGQKGVGTELLGLKLDR